MKIAIVIPVLNQFALAQTAIDFVVNSLDSSADLIILDNASDKPFIPVMAVNAPKIINKQIVRLEHNIGVYPTFWEALKHTDADVLAFFHSDLMISERGWDTRVLAHFEANPKLGLIGFIGSNEIDVAGGRGLGTTSNFMGDSYMHRTLEGVENRWVGSPAESHGVRNTGFTEAAVIDGCAMVFRREVLQHIKQRPNFPIHHFYDRMLSTETRELQMDIPTPVPVYYEMGVLGIGCDHISGQTVNQEPAYDKAAQVWAESHGLQKGELHNWDSVLYKEAEKQWLTEYRDIKHLVPCRV